MISYKTRNQLPKVAPWAAMIFAKDPAYPLQPAEVKITFFSELTEAELWGPNSPPCGAAGQWMGGRVVAGKVRHKNRGYPVGLGGIA